METNKKQFSAAHFDSFSHACPFFTTKTNVNNGYGCLHGDQDEYEVGKDGVKRGKCYCWSCPLGISADDDSLDNPNIDWDGDKPEPGDVDNEYLLVRTDDIASPDEKQAWYFYQQYINRYNK